MKKTTLLASALGIALSSAPAMAEDFHALSVLHAAPAPMQDTELAATEGGATCDTGTGQTATNENPGGVCLTSGIGGAQGASFAVANNAPVTGANFLQVTGG